MRPPSLRSPRFLILLLLIALTILPPLFHTRAAQADQGPTDRSETEVEKENESEWRVVRAYFDDPALVATVADLAPWEVNYEAGYLVVETTAADRSRLTALGFRLEVDEALTALLNQPSWPPGLESIPGYPCYRTVEETFAAAQTLTTSYPNLASWNDIGDSWEKQVGLGGYDLRVLKLTNAAVSGPKPKLFAMSAVHAREYTTAELMTRFAEYLVSNYGIDADATWLLDHHEIHLLLQANPDGRKKAEQGILWRKNTNQNYCSATSNSRGADLNRNFPFQWGCCGGSSGNQCSDTYRGAAAASEPETAAIVAYVRSQFPDQRPDDLTSPAPADATGIFLDIHSYSELVLWPWGFTNQPAPNGNQLQTLGRKFAYFNGYEPQQSVSLYPTDGTTTSFAYGELGVAAFTFELGTAFFQACSTFENTILPDNLAALIYAAKSARTPYLTPAGPDTLNVALSTNSVPAGTAVALTATINDTRYNNQNGTEPTQLITAAEYYLDTPPWNGGAPLPMSASDGSFNSKIEAVTATVNSSALAPGRHVLFVRGQDASGSWGPFSAIFLTITGGTPPTATAVPPSPTAVPPSATVAPPTATPPSGGTLFQDTFESDQGWWVNPDGTDDATTGQWARAIPEAVNYNGPKQLTAASGSFDLVTGPLAGANAGSHDIDNGVTTVRSPAVTLPSSGNITLSFSYYFAHASNASSADFFRARLISNSGSTLLFEQLGAGTDRDASWSSVSVSLNAFAGQTIQIQFEAADNGSGSLVEAGVDELLVSGSGASPTATPAPPTATAVPPTATPPSGGPLFQDTFESDQGWVTNPAGTDNATTGQWARAIPEAVNYNGPKQLTAASGSFDLVTGPLAGANAGSHDIDNGVTTVRSPAVTLPSSGNITLSFSYYFAHASNASSADFFRARLISNSGSTLLFEQLGAGTDRDASWSSVSVSLNAFAGQTIQIQFEAADNGSGSLVEAGVDDLLVTP